jgi:hypothetical protein
MTTPNAHPRAHTFPSVSFSETCAQRRCHQTLRIGNGDKALHALFFERMPLATYLEVYPLVAIIEGQNK